MRRINTTMRHLQAFLSDVAANRSLSAAGAGLARDHRGMNRLDLIPRHESVPEYNRKLEKAVKDMQDRGTNIGHSATISTEHEQLVPITTNIDAPTVDNFVSHINQQNWNQAHLITHQDQMIDIVFAMVCALNSVCIQKTVLTNSNNNT